MPFRSRKIRCDVVSRTTPFSRDACNCVAFEVIILLPFFSGYQPEPFFKTKGAAAKRPFSFGKSEFTLSLTLLQHPTGSNAYTQTFRLL